MKTIKQKASALFILLGLLLSAAAPRPQAIDSTPPDEVTKLIFIHHSTGENWLTDGYGDLGRTLGENNYFVSDTNYGWGPDSIGDRTDIPNWKEWFASDNTPTYMDALFRETEQHSSYTRTLADPGGENQIIMFKSCFPNSALEGSPNDPPGTYGGLSVSGAKHTYNAILPYFAAHPEKLFVVITAPPLSDPTYAENARAFNNWLLNDWLRENGYTLNNVAVFDFYNILTDAGAHHRINNGQVEHIDGARNTLHYPSGDDHPSVEGSRKATEEFVPMLNVFYRRWKENAPTQPPPTADSTPQAESQPEPSTAATASGFSDNFDSAPQPWEAFRDETTSSVMACGAEPGAGRSGNALKIDFNIALNSWGTCALMYESHQNWSAGSGVTFYYRAAQAGTRFDVTLYAGPLENRETYLYTVETPAESVTDWVLTELRWQDFHRANWEENAGAVFAKADQINGMAFGFGTEPNLPNVSALWVDDLGLMTATAAAAEDAPPASAQTAVPEEPDPATGQAQKPSLPCAGALILPMSIIAGLTALVKKRG